MAEKNDLMKAMEQIDAEEQFEFERPFVADILLAILCAIKMGISKQRLIEILRVFVDQIERQL